jgi:uncharacterized protein YdaU (DUF1376 family)
MPAKARNPYFPFYPADYVEATRKMSLEERGAYMDIICLQMMSMGRVEDNERLMAASLVISTRKWRAVRGKLIDAGKISIRDGLIIQERCLRELDELLSKRKNLSEAAAAREQFKRGSEPVHAPLGSELDANQPRTDLENQEKPNEINDDNTTVVPLRARVLDSDSDSEKKETPYSPPSGGVREGGHVGVGKAIAAVAAGMIAASVPLAAEPVQNPAQVQPSLFSEPEAKPAPPSAPVKAKRGRTPKSRLPADWTLPAEWREETKAKFGATDTQIDRQVERFVRYWTSDNAVGGGIKADWKMTWLNSVDMQITRFGGLGPAGTGSAPAPAWGQKPREVVRIGDQEYLV